MTDLTIFPVLVTGSDEDDAEARLNKYLAKVSGASHVGTAQEISPTIYGAFVQAEPNTDLTDLWVVLSSYGIDIKLGTSASSFVKAMEG